MPKPKKRRARGDAPKWVFLADLGAAGAGAAGGASRTAPKTPKPGPPLSAQESKTPAPKAKGQTAAGSGGPPAAAGSGGPPAAAGSPGPPPVKKKETLLPAEGDSDEEARGLFDDDPIDDERFDGEGLGKIWGLGDDVSHERGEGDAQTKKRPASLSEDLDPDLFDSDEDDQFLSGIFVSTALSPADDDFAAAETAPIEQEPPIEDHDAEENPLVQQMLAQYNEWTPREDDLLVEAARKQFEKTIMAQVWCWDEESEEEGVPGLREAKQVVEDISKSMVSEGLWTVDTGADKRADKSNSPNSFEEVQIARGRACILFLTQNF